MFYRILNVIYSVKKEKRKFWQWDVFISYKCLTTTTFIANRKKLYRDYIIHYVWLFIHKDAVLAFGFVI